MRAFWTVGLVTAASAMLLLSSADGFARGHGGGHHGGGHHGGGHAHGGMHGGGHPHHGFGGGHHHRGFGGGHGFGGPRFHAGRPQFGRPGFVYLPGRPYPRGRDVVFVGAPRPYAYGPRYIGGIGPRYLGGVAPGCSTRQSVGVTPWGWRKIVTVKTCYVP